MNTLTLLSNTHTRIWAWLMSTLILNEARPSRWLLPPCRVKKFKLLGTRLSEDLKWTGYVNDVTSSCYLTIIPGYNCFAQLQHETSRNFLVTHFMEEMSYVFLFNFFSLPLIFTLHWWPLAFLILSLPLQKFYVVPPTKKCLL